MRACAASRRAWTSSRWPTCSARIGTGVEVMSSNADTQRSLDVGGITADALSIYFQRFGLMFTLSLIPAIISLLITGAVPQVSSFQAANNPAAAGWPIFFVTLGAFLASTLSNALIVLAAFDT